MFLRILTSFKKLLFNDAVDFNNSNRFLVVRISIKDELCRKSNNILNRVMSSDNDGHVGFCDEITQPERASKILILSIF